MSGKIPAPPEISHPRVIAERGKFGQGWIDIGHEVVRFSEALESLERTLSLAKCCVDQDFVACCAEARTILFGKPFGVGAAPDGRVGITQVTV